MSSLFIYRKLIIFQGFVDEAQKLGLPLLFKVQNCNGHIRLIDSQMILIRFLKLTKPHQNKVQYVKHHEGLFH